jgi:hypothetical protein
MPISGAIDGLLKSVDFQQKVRAIQALAMSELQQAIWKNVYSQPEGSWYERTYDLLNAIECTDLKVSSSTIDFKVIFNSEKMHHTTLYGSEKYGLEPGDYIDELIVPWINYGWRWEGYEGRYDNFRARKETLFIENAIKEIEKGIKQKVENLISLEIKKIFNKR